MSNAAEEYNTADTVTDDIPESGDTVDNTYVHRPGQSDEIPVISDNAPVEQPNDTRNPDSDEALERDDAEAIDKSNIIDERTRGAAKPSGSYAEPGDDEGLPGPEDGTSSNR